jgi:hypothetical protein
LRPTGPGIREAVDEAARGLFHGRTVRTRRKGRRDLLRSHDTRSWAAPEIQGRGRRTRADGQGHGRRRRSKVVGGAPARMGLSHPTEEASVARNRGAVGESPKARAENGILNTVNSASCGGGLVKEGGEFYFARDEGGFAQ